ncbi:chorismate mutase [Afifella pfennigii]|uniref:chorismate mutase n=1 Tax=Afifella pfennigii TaxID=209897 RepID=UPI00068A896D|nr:chorismate mutase [Afifella pfennigii]
MTFPPAQTLPENCRAMDEVRAEIDRLDRILVALMAERQRYIEAAGRIKPRAEEVYLPWRVEDVVAKVLAEAEKQGLSRAIAEPVWRQLIASCIEHEHDIWALEHAGGERNEATG